MADKFEAWGLVELMEHQRMAGKLSEQPVGGGNMLRVDIPNGETFRTAYYGASAIYAVHITDEAAARKLVGDSGSRPPYAYELQHAVARIAPSASVYEPEYEDEQHDPETDDCPI